MNDVKQQARFREQEENSAAQRAAILGLQYFDTRNSSQSSPLISGYLSSDEMYKGKLVPLQAPADGKTLIFGITSGTPQSLLRELRDRYQSNSVQFVMISNEGFREYMRRYDPPKQVIYDDVKIGREGDSETISSVSQTLESVRSDDILSYLIEQADKLGASDIHIECQRENVRVRLRVDGTLHSVARISHDKHRVLQASIASKANISTASTDAQTGHMQQEIKDSEYSSHHILNMRIETVPTVYGQDAVIRLFNFDDTLLNIEQLGLGNQEQKNIAEIISHPHGMLMVVGPTGSGKSTTLYSILNALNTQSRKLVTLEDPVEYSIPGITQIPVNTGEGDSFSEKLRAVLRIDPDVMMLGEIRDSDTAKTAIQASITGHLVLSTFHADSASSALSRMIDLIGQNPIFSTAIRMIIGQRLVRRLDDATKIEYEPDESTKKWVKAALADLPAHVTKPDLDNFKLWKPGTSEEVPFGYKGRLLIMEQLLVTEEIQAYLRGTIVDANAKSIELAAREQGMVTMLQDGVLRALRGETTLEEISRVI